MRVSLLIYILFFGIAIAAFAQDLTLDSLIDQALEESNIDKGIAEDNAATQEVEESKASIKVMEKFDGGVQALTISNKDSVMFEDDLEIKLDKCWHDKSSGLIKKYIALISIKDRHGDDFESFEKHWVFSHNVELNSYSTDRYFIFLDKCLQ